MKLTARSLKATIVVDANELGRAGGLGGAPKLPFEIHVAGRTLRGTLNAKSVRKVISTIHDGVDCAVIIQGKLTAGDVLDEAGIVAQPRVKKEAAAA